MLYEFGYEPQGVKLLQETWSGLHMRQHFPEMGVGQSILHTQSHGDYSG